MPENVSIDVIRERYGMPSKIESSHPVGSLEEAVHFLLHASMHIMSRDGYALPFVFARESNGEKLRIIGLQAEDRVGKHIAIRQAASVLSRIPIDWAVQVSEAWTAIVDPKKPLYRHAADDPDRGECIAVSGVSATGQFCNARVDFTRLGKKIVFGKESNDKDPVNIMVPIAKAIARKS